MPAPSIYTSRDASAPSITTGTGYTRMQSLLTAVLVSGYGGRPGAGWTLMVSTANTTIFKSADPAGCYLHLWRGSSTGTVWLGLSEWMNPAGDPNTHYDAVNLRSYSTKPTSTAHTWGHAFTMYTANYWAIAADDKTFILYLTTSNGYNYYAGTNALHSSFGMEYPGLLYVGRHYSSRGFNGTTANIIQGGHLLNSASTTQYTKNEWRSITTCPRNVLTGMDSYSLLNPSIDPLKDDIRYTWANQYWNLALYAPTPLTAVRQYPPLTMTPVHLITPGSLALYPGSTTQYSVTGQEYAGTMYGICYDHMLYERGATWAMGALGQSVTGWVGQVTLSDGFQYVLCPFMGYHAGNNLVFLTNNPAFWGGA